MALVGTYTFRGLAISTAYAKIVSMSGSKTGGWNAQLGVYATEEDASAQPPQQPLDQVQITASYVVGQDSLVTIYEAAKEHPAFVGMTTDEPGTRLTRLEFLSRFEGTERRAIRAAAKASTAVEDYIGMLEVATFIDVTRPDTIAGVQALEVSGLIAPGRATVILRTTLT